MNLPDFSQFEALNSLRNKMGAELVDFQVSLYKQLSNVEKKQLETEGIEITFDNDNFKALKDGTLAYKNNRVLIYIRDLPVYGGRYRGRDKLPKFHVSDCVTLKKMRSNNRLGRYVVSTRTDGLFEIRYIAHSKKQSNKDIKSLRVCKNCLDSLNFNGYCTSWDYITRNKIFDKFSLDDFFSQYPITPIIIKPRHTNVTAPINDYSSDFRMIAGKLKEKCNWICQKCGRDLSSKKIRKYLHVHHKNGEKNDNRPDNLKVLCVECHSNESMHQHLKNETNYEYFKSLYRS